MLLRSAFALAAALLPTLALACGPIAPVFDGDPVAGVSISVGRIADVTWEPRLIHREAVPKDSGLSLTIGLEGKVQGTTGCNRFVGTADLDAGWMQLSALSVTDMACLDPERSARESAWLKALDEARTFVVSPGGLWLMREDGSVVACLE